MKPSADRDSCSIDRGSMAAFSKVQKTLQTLGFSIFSHNNPPDVFVTLTLPKSLPYIVTYKSPTPKTSITSQNYYQLLYQITITQQSKHLYNLFKLLQNQRTIHNIYVYQTKT